MLYRGRQRRNHYSWRNSDKRPDFSCNYQFQRCERVWLYIYFGVRLDAGIVKLSNGSRALNASAVGGRHARLYGSSDYDSSPPLKGLQDLKWLNATILAVTSLEQKAWATNRPQAGRVPARWDICYAPGILQPH